MGNIFNTDFKDFIRALYNHDVEYILVGGYSVILHGYARTTGDMDIWVNRTSANYNKLQIAFKEFGMPLFDMTEQNFLFNDNYDVFTFGRPPVSIDIMNKLKGLEFDPAYKNSVEIELEGLKIRVINFHDLIKAKKASARPKDLDDLENLKEN
jgi:predicted nucleotidyltransferase